MRTKLSIILLAAIALFASCGSDDYYDPYRPTALVTVKPTADSFILQLNDSVRLIPDNMTQSPFGEKEVRALVNYQLQEKTADMQRVHIIWIDSIRTKMPVASAGENDKELFGDDPVEIMRDWVTCAEDGYLTLRIRTNWGEGNKVHYLNLLTDTNPENPYELELRHDANGDIPLRTADALIAFNLRQLMANAEADTVRFTLRWKSFSGMKKLDFSLRQQPMYTGGKLVKCIE